jgi:uncharacterized membrane protein YdjX (TVP38/TMEM64 family)
VDGMGAPMQSVTLGLVGFTLFAAAGGAALGVEGYLRPLLVIGTFLGGCASFLSAVSGFLDARQRRRHAEEVHRQRATSPAAATASVR